MESGKLSKENQEAEACSVKVTGSLNTINQNAETENQTIKRSRSLSTFAAKPVEILIEPDPDKPLIPMQKDSDNIVSKTNNNNDGIISLAGVPIGAKKEDIDKDLSEQEVLLGGAESLENNVGEVSVQKADSAQSTEIICRICHDNPFDMTLMQPCSCKGTMGLVHQECLEHWLGESGKTSCEICGFEYILKRKPRYTGIASVFAWIRHPTSPNDTKNLFFDLACFFILTPLASISAWLCILGSQHYSTGPKPPGQAQFPSSGHRYGNRMDEGSNSRWTSIGLVTLTITLLSAYYIWLFVAFKYHYNVWKTWQGRNYIVEILPIPLDKSDGDESKDKPGTIDDYSISIITPEALDQSETSSDYTLSSILIHDTDSEFNQTGVINSTSNVKVAVPKSQ